MPPTIIITRPERQAQAFAQDLQRENGEPLPVLIAPLMQIDPLIPDQPIGAPDHVIFTSINAVAQAERLGLPKTAIAWCVGDQTTAAAEDFGFAVENAQGDSKSLFAKILSARPDGEIVHVHGAHVTGQVAQTLTEAGLPCDAIVAYDQSPRPASPALIDQLSGDAPLIAPLFSPRSARLLAESAPIRAPLTVIAMSDSVAAAATAIPGADVIRSNFPDKTAMIAATLHAFGAACGRKTA